MESVVGENLSGPALIMTATWRDLNNLRQLEKACFPIDAWPLWDMIGILTLPSVIRLKAVVDEQMVGFIGADVRSSESLAWIATIGVLPAHRRQGIGGALLETCETVLGGGDPLGGGNPAGERGNSTPKVSRVRLTVRKSNQTAINLYEGCGYQKIGLWPAYYQDKEDGVVMEKGIKSKRVALVGWRNWVLPGALPPKASNFAINRLLPLNFWAVSESVPIFIPPGETRK